MKPTITEKELRAHLPSAPAGSLKIVLAVVGDRMYKREADGLYYLLDDGSKGAHPNGS